MGVHYISAEHLTIERVGQIVSEGIKLSLSEDARNRITRCREYLNRKMENNAQPIYDRNIISTTCAIRMRRNIAKGYTVE